MGVACPCAHVWSVPLHSDVARLGSGHLHFCSGSRRTPLCTPPCPSQTSNSTDCCEKLGYNHLVLQWVGLGVLDRKVRTPEGESRLACRTPSRVRHGASPRHRQSIREQPRFPRRRPEVEVVDGADFVDVPQVGARTHRFDLTKAQSIPCVKDVRLESYEASESTFYGRSP